MVFIFYPSLQSQSEKQNIFIIGLKVDALEARGHLFKKSYINSSRYLKAKSYPQITIINNIKLNHMNRLQVCQTLMFSNTQSQKYISSHKPMENKAKLTSKIKCIGCKSFFIQSETLQLQNLLVEFKNYSDVPALSPIQKEILLRTIVAFLNTKGGTIYIGVEDQKCSVVGNTIAISRHQQFRAQLQNLCQDIHPLVIIKKQIKVDFVPVMKRNTQFTGKYVTKIIVNQGRTDTVYTKKQRYKIKNQFDQEQNIQLLIGYIRINSGANSKKEGLFLQDQIYRRSKDPNDIKNFHQGCHPKPASHKLEVRIIGFRVERQEAKKVAFEVSKIYLRHGIKRQDQNYEGNRRLYTIKFNTFNEADAIFYEIKNLKQFNFVYQGVEDGMHLFIPEVRFEKNCNSQMIKFRTQPYTNYRRIDDERENQIQDSDFQPKLRYNDKNKREYQPDSFKKENQQKSHQIQQSKTNFRQQYNLKPIQRQQQRRKVYKVVQQPTTKRNISRVQQIVSKNNVYYLFTHIDRNQISKLKDYLMGILPRKYNFQCYNMNLLLQIFSSELNEIKYLISKNQKQLRQFGYKQKIMHGVANGHIYIQDFHFNKSQFLKNEVTDILKKYQVKSIRFISLQNKNNEDCLDIWMNQKNAVQSLEKLVKQKKLRRFSRSLHQKLKLMLQYD